MRVIVFASGEVGYLCVRGMFSQENKEETRNVVSLIVTTDIDVDSKKIEALSLSNGVKSASWENLEDSCLDGTDLILLLWWPRIIKDSIIKRSRRGAVNLHPSLLPYNRGKHPYYWAIVDETPYGVSIHHVTPDIDDGPIIYQKKIDVPIWISGGQLYELCKQEIVSLFLEHYHDIIIGDYVSHPQDSGIATFHWAKNLKSHSMIDLDRKYKARDLINIIRGRSFGPGKPSAQFCCNGKKYNIQTIITEEPE